MAAGLLLLPAVVAGIAVMLNAASSRRGNGPWVIKAGWEYAVVLAAAGASIALRSPGEASVDHPVGLDRSTARSVGGVALGAAAGFTALLALRPTPGRPGATDREGEPLWTTA
jgi:hypothetical protein